MADLADITCPGLDEEEITNFFSHFFFLVITLAKVRIRLNRYHLANAVAGVASFFAIHHLTAAFG